MTKVTGCIIISLMNELQILNFYNEWWVTGKVPESLFQEYRRSKFTALEMELTRERISSIVGPRQTGKTTLIYQLIDFLLRKKIDPKRILFLLLSDPSFINNQEFLESCLTTYEEIILREPLRDLHEPVYMFLDEIHYLDNWELFLKRYYDLGYKIKFVISGSASSKILRKGRESLVGRISETKLPPLNFWEFLQFQESKIRNKKRKEKINQLSILGWEKIWDTYFDFWRYKSWNSFGKRILEEKQYVVSQQQIASLFLNEYFERGGFPGVYKEKDLNTVYRYLNQDVLERVTAQDIPQIAEVRDIRLLQSLILTVASRSSSIFSYRNLAQESGARSETIRTYLVYLASAFLVSELWQFRKAELAKLKADKKFFICDLGLRNAILKHSRERIFLTEEKGLAAETLVYNHLKEKERNFFFWRRGDFEVDFVINSFGFIVPVEVKFRKTIGKDDLKGIKQFIREYKLKGGIIVTEADFDYREDLVFIPLWLFLLLNS